MDPMPMMKTVIIMTTMMRMILVVILRGALMDAGYDGSRCRLIRFSILIMGLVSQWRQFSLNEERWFRY